MISLKVLSSAAVMALVLPMAAPTASFAQGQKVRGAAVGVAGVPHAIVGPPPVHFSGGGGPPPVRFNGGGGPPPVHFSGGGVYRGGYGRHGGGGFIPGAVAGAVIGGAIASQSYGYYGGPGYYAPGYYDDQYYDDGAVAVAPAPVGDDAVAYCMQTYRSYDPASGTYLGYDGLRHLCP